jgi:hypothetical protein
MSHLILSRRGVIARLMSAGAVVALAPPALARIATGDAPTLRRTAYSPSSSTAGSTPASSGARRRSP